MPPTFLTDWFSQNIPVWEEVLHPYKGAPGLRFLEIGSFDGRSACWLLQNILTDASSTITCVDLFEIGEELREIIRVMHLKIPADYDIDGNFDRNISAIGASGKMTKLRGPSSEMLRTLPLSSFDMMYIDGSHRAANVLTDIVFGWNLLKPDGLMILDDYQWNCFPFQPLKNPKIAIDAFLTVFAGSYVLLRKDLQVIVHKRDPELAAAMSAAPSPIT